MKKQVILRSLLGIPIGVAIGYIITIVTSLIWAEGFYSPCVPELIDAMGNEINAVMLQALLCGLLGAGFGGASVVWEMEDWSVAVQTGIYFIIVSLIMFPTAWFTYWMEHTIQGFLGYFGVFFLIFAVIWIIQFIIGRYTVEKLNSKLYKTKADK